MGRPPAAVRPVACFTTKGRAHTKMLGDAVGASTLHRVMMFNPVVSFCKCPSYLASLHVVQSRSTTNLHSRSPIFYLQQALACEILLQIRNTTTAVVV